MYLSWGSAEYTAIMLVFSLGLIVAQSFLSVPVQQRLGLPSTGLLVGILCNLAKWAMLPVTSVSLVAVLLVCASTLSEVLAWALVYTVSTPLLAELTNPAYIGTVMTLSQVHACT